MWTKRRSRYAVGLLVAWVWVGGLPSEASHAADDADMPAIVTLEDFIGRDAKEKSPKADTDTGDEATSEATQTEPVDSATPTADEGEIVDDISPLADGDNAAGDDESPALIENEFTPAAPVAGSGYEMPSPEDLLLLKSEAQQDSWVDSPKDKTAPAKTTEAAVPSDSRRGHRWWHSRNNKGNENAPEVQTANGRSFWRRSKTGSTQKRTRRDKRNAATSILNDPQVQQLLDTLSGMHEYRVQREAKDELISLGPKVAPAVLPLLNHPQRLTRILAVSVLRETKAPEAYGAFLQLMADQDERVRFHAHMSLRHLTPQDFGYHYDGLAEDRVVALSRWREFLTKKNLLNQAVAIPEAPVAAAPMVTPAPIVMPTEPVFQGMTMSAADLTKRDIAELEMVATAAAAKADAMSDEIGEDDAENLQYYASSSSSSPSKAKKWLGRVLTPIKKINLPGIKSRSKEIAETLKPEPYTARRKDTRAKRLDRLGEE